MSFPRPKRRSALLVSTPLLFLLLLGLAFCLSRPATKASAGSQHAGPRVASRTTPAAARARSSSLIFNATLGNYTDTIVQLGANTVIVPDAAPIETNEITITASSGF